MRKVRSAEMKLEVWNSDHNRQERHYFLPDSIMHGYQCQGAYVFGYNPELVSEETAAKIIALIEAQ